MNSHLFCKNVQMENLNVFSAIQSKVFVILMYQKMFLTKNIFLYLSGHKV